MTKKKTNSQSKSKKQNNTDEVMADVLYQKLGDTWYAFVEHEGDCYYEKVDEEVVNQKVIEDGLDRFFGKDN